MKFYSQDKQDEFLETTVFKGYRNGFFVDVGANDGITINNSLYFEENNNWTGINIEPIKSTYDKLIENRPKCINLNCAISDENGTAEFILNKGYTEMISGLKNQFDPRHKERLLRELQYFGGTSEVVMVPTKRLETVFSEHNVKHVNYLSIDVEGAEFEVIKSIDFDKVFIDVIGYENNYDDQGQKIMIYLQDKGFVLLHKSMDIFMINEKSTFHNKTG